MNTNAIRALRPVLRGLLPVAGVVLGPAWAASGQVARLMPSVATAESSFGYAIAVHDDEVIVGAPTDSTEGTHAGAAFVYREINAGMNSWTESARLVSPTPEPGDYFGAAVAIHGEYAAVSAMLDPAIGTAAGAVYIYRRDAGGPGAWGLVQTIVAPERLDHDHEWFGMSVAMDAHTLVVGGPNAVRNGRMVGALYVFDHKGGGATPFEHARTVTLADSLSSRALGASVALYADTIVSGDPVGEYNETQSGMAYVFSRDAGGPGAWGMVQALAPASPDYGDYFGADVAIHGNAIVIGAPRDDDFGFNAGRAYAYSLDEGAGEGWRATAPLEFSRVSDSDEFGVGVACTESVVAVASDLDDVAGAGRGALALFTPEGDSAWRERVIVAPPVETSVTSWGDRLLIDDGRLFASATGSDGPLAGGLVYVYLVGESVLACGADADGDGFVTADDLTYIIFRYGNMGPAGVPGDANLDGFVNISDVVHVIYRLGTICPLNL